MTAAMEDEKRRCIKTKTITHTHTQKPIHKKHEHVKTKTIESYNLKEDQFFSFPANITTMTAAVEDEKRRYIKTKTIARAAHIHTNQFIGSMNM
jgi:hypothetical protein